MTHDSRSSPSAGGDGTLPEVYEHAPTLMGSPTPGAQGAVRVWAPDRRLIRATISRLGIVALLGTVVVVLFHHVGIVSVMYPLLTSAAGLVLAVATMVRPCYVTTDDAGIGLTTWMGSEALRWSDIDAAIKLGNHPDHPRALRLMAPAPLDINLVGYPPAAAQELIALVLERARLKRHPWRSGVFLRQDDPLVSGQTPAALPASPPDDLKDPPLPGPFSHRRGRGDER